MNARQSERTCTSLPVMIRITGGALVPGVVRNLGNHGLFIQTNRVLPVNSQVIVTLDLSRRQRTRRESIAGTVVHGYNGGVGFRADDPDVPVRDVVLSCAGSDAGAGPVSRWFVTQNHQHDSTVSGYRN